MSLKFEAWLSAQQRRDDFIGELARRLDIEEFELIMTRRKHNEHTCWVDIVIDLQEPKYVTMFNNAWQEFLQEKSAIETQPTP